MRIVPIPLNPQPSRRQVGDLSTGGSLIPPGTGPSVFERYYRELLNFIARKVNDRDAAADLAQESYARVIAMQRSGELVADPRALLYRVARNLLIDNHRRANVREHEDLAAVAEPEHLQAPVHEQPEQAYVSAQALEAYAAAIESLPPRAREAFILHVFEELPQAEVAKRMGISRSMVEKHIVRGMLACRQCARQLEGHPNDGTNDAQ